MATKHINSRVVNKHDLEANWIKATSFIPLQGEVIIYDVEVDKDGKTLALPENRTIPYTHERMKIGDGVKYVTDLPFIDEYVNKQKSQVRIVTWEADD